MQSFLWKENDKNRAAKRSKAAPLSAFAPAEEEEAVQSGSLPLEERLQEAQALQDKGNEEAEAGNHSAALIAWDRAIVLDPERAVLHELKSQVLLDVGQSWQAVRSAMRATQLAPSWPEAHLTLARAQLALGERVESFGEMKWFAPGKESASALLQASEALASLETVLKLQPGHPEACEELPAVRVLVLKQRADPEAAGQRVRVV